MSGKQGQPNPPESGKSAMLDKGQPNPPKLGNQRNLDKGQPNPPKLGKGRKLDTTIFKKGVIFGSTEPA
ncbi:hypothetical protein [Gloeothece verrucosa]|uniref:hypothetical protein n=1 Tax=Gloeothece verrucosa TaxID=2546359 RepID=UPI0002F61DB6|nr:hypothetical protein [Gloeothece verrucosa]